MSLADVQFQTRAHRLIQRAIARERVPHAYIFHGPDGVGKELLARGLAQLLLCEQPIEHQVKTTDPLSRFLDVMRTGCGQCEDCRLVAAGTHPDWHLIYRQLNRDHPDPVIRRRKALEIGVDVLRHFVIEKVGHTPMRGRAKVFVIREADRITPQAQNALLKTLEEPPGTTFIILLVSSLDRLLATTLSRCQLIGFDSLPTAFVRGQLGGQRPDVPADHLDWYASIAEGRIGAAIEAVDDELYDVNDRLVAALAPSDKARARSGRGASPGPSEFDGSRLNSPATVKLWTDLAGELGTRYRKRDPEISTTEATRRGLKALLSLAAAWYADVLRVQAGGGGLAASGAQQLDAAEPEDEPSSERSVDDAPDESMGLFAGMSAVLPNAAHDSRPASKTGRQGVAKPVADAGPEHGEGQRLINRKWKTALDELGSAMSSEAAVDAVRRIAHAEHQLDLNANTQLVVEVLLNDLARICAGQEEALA
jgi:DNA polymerase III subunit delta'